MGGRQELSSSTLASCSLSAHVLTSLQAVDEQTGCFLLSFLRYNHNTIHTATPLLLSVHLHYLARSRVRSAATSAATSVVLRLRQIVRGSMLAAAPLPVTEAGRPPLHGRPAGSRCSRMKRLPLSPRLTRSVSSTYVVSSVPLALSGAVIGMRPESKSRN